MARSQLTYIMAGALAGVLVIVAILALLGYFSTPPAPEVRLKASTITVGLSTFDIVEKRPHLFEDLPVSIEVVRYQVPPQSIDSLLKGETQLTVIPVELAGSVMLKDKDVYIIAVDNMMNQAIIAPGDSDIQDPQDLRGRRVAAVVGSGTFALFRSFMKTLYGINVSPEGPSDVIVVNVRPGETLTALEKGDVDAAVIWDPIVSLAVSTRGMKIVAEYNELWGRVNPGLPAPMLVWIARGEVVKDKEVLRQVLEIHRRAAEYWNVNLTGTISVLMDLYNLPQDVAEKVWQRNRMDAHNCITEWMRDAMVKVWELAMRGGYLDEMPPVDNIITCSYIER